MVHFLEPFGMAKEYTQLFSERLVAHYTGGIGVAGSNPADPTILNHCEFSFFQGIRRI